MADQNLKNKLIHSDDLARIFMDNLETKCFGCCMGLIKWSVCDTLLEKSHDKPLFHCICLYHFTGSTHVLGQMTNFYQIYDALFLPSLYGQMTQYNALSHRSHMHTIRLHYYLPKFLHKYRKVFGGKKISYNLVLIIWGPILLVVFL